MKTNTEKYRSIRATSTRFLVASLATLFTACGPMELPEHQYTSLKGVVQKDLEALENEDLTEIENEDPRIRSMFRLAFGGTDGNAIRNFIGERLRYILDEHDLLGSRVLPAPVYTAWNAPSGPRVSEVNDELVLGGTNYGAAFWFQGVLDGAVKTLHIPRLNLSIPIESSRVGIMTIGPGYASKVRGYDAHRSRMVEFEPTPEYRQAILIHEARHSDCTGGIRASEVAAIRGARSLDDFEAVTTGTSCNHFHVTCPMGHRLAGTPNCDRSPWGAYTYGFLYARGRTGPHLSYRQKMVLHFMANDSLGRLVFLRDNQNHYDAQGLYRGRYGNPDPSSAGVRN